MLPSRTQNPVEKGAPGLDGRYPAGDAKIVLLLLGTLTYFASSPDLEGEACLSEMVKWVSTYSHLLQTFEGLTVPGKLGFFFFYL